MRKIFLAVVGALFFLTSCNAPKPLYQWHDYSEALYDYTRDQDEKSKKDLYKALNEVIRDQKKGLLKTVPPGVYADYGYLLMMDGDYDKAMKMFENELDLYPESAILMENILKRLEKQAESENSESTDSKKKSVKSKKSNSKKNDEKKKSRTGR